MRELFLTSSVHAVAHDIAKRVDLENRRALVFIDTAAEVERGDKTWLKDERQALVDAGFTVSDYSITDKSHEQLEDDLCNYDVLYLSGGNTAYLLYQSQKTGFLSLVKELVGNRDKIYIGTSAGSIIAGPRLSDYDSDERPELENRECYGFVNVTIAPHWGSEHFRERYLGKRLKAVYNKDQVTLLLLTDYQYVHVRDDQMSVIDTHISSS